MDELARRAGATKPVVYELFGSKDGLFGACVDRSIERLATDISTAVRAQDEPEARLRAGGLAFIRFAAGNRVAWDLMSMGGSFEQKACAVRDSQAELIRELMAEMAARRRRPARAGGRRPRRQRRLRGGGPPDVGAPGRSIEQIADWIADLLIPGLRRFT